ncbi:MAG: class I SAM-dependent methyltransferase [Candidatus Omnitrophota bacterium]
MDYDILTPGLHLLKEAPRYIEWIYNTIRPYIGRRIFEVGSGMGYYGNFFKNFELYCATEINEEYCGILKKIFSGYNNIKVFKYDIVKEDIGKVSALRIDTVICIEVLEHIEKDEVALEHMYSILNPGGRLIVCCPAFSFLYGSNDNAIGHYRRYSKKELVDKLKSAHFCVERVFFHNLLGVPAWFLNGRILRRNVASLSQIKLFNTIVPFLRVLEKTVSPFIGLNIVAIAKKK